ncbi:hypothetical protein GCM10023333_41610 [Ferrimonas pelagia]|uniref:HPt domain-containing protein n=2 Tax=Ferrimonas pelagia TaxID=1177826 RepID=A0ABP9FIZ8_9GAMM
MAGVMDKDKIAQLAQDAGEDMLPMLLEVFLEELVHSQQELAQAGSAELAPVAHKIKGSAATFGASALYNASGTLESVAKGIEVGDPGILKHECLEIIQRTLQIYKSEFNIGQ